MSGFIKYQHIEKFGSDEVEGIEQGIVHLFPKIDGTNASVWCANNGVCFGSRNREITPDNDNQGFAVWASQNTAFTEYFKAYPHHRRKDGIVGTSPNCWGVYGMLLLPRTLGIW